jgi:hypothetical protein
MVAAFGRHDGAHHVVAPNSLVEGNPSLDVQRQLARQGMLTVGTTAIIEGRDGHGGCRLAVPEPGILELDDQRFRFGWHLALPRRVLTCRVCGRDCYKVHQVDGVWSCRRCAGGGRGLDYSSRHVHRTIPHYARAKWLRSRLSRYGVAAELFTPIAPRPLHHRRFWRLVLELMEIERGLVEHLHRDVRLVLERRHDKAQRRQQQRSRSQQSRARDPA